MKVNVARHIYSNSSKPTRKAVTAIRNLPSITSRRTTYLLTHLWNVKCQ